MDPFFLKAESNFPLLKMIYFALRYYLCIKNNCIFYFVRFPMILALFLLPGSASLIRIRDADDTDPHHWLPQGCIFSSAPPLPENNDIFFKENAQKSEGRGEKEDISLYPSGKYHILSKYSPLLVGEHGIGSTEGYSVLASFRSVAHTKGDL